MGVSSICSWIHPSAPLDLLLGQYFPPCWEASGGDGELETRPCALPSPQKIFCDVRNASAKGVKYREGGNVG